MDPVEYEEFVAAHFRSLGYQVTTTPGSGDYGIDVIAERGEDKVAIQAKMYGQTSRKVNRAMVMELVGSMKYAGCTRAVIVTDGEFAGDAVEVATKLGVEIIHLDRDAALPHDHNLENDDSILPIVDSQEVTFEDVWRMYVMPLEGKHITTATGRPNKILSVDWGQVRRETSKGKIGTIPIEAFRYAFDRLAAFGEVTRDSVNQQFSKERCSSGVFAILSRVPFLNLESRPAKLTLRRESSVVLKGASRQDT